MNWVSNNTQNIVFLWRTYFIKELESAAIESIPLAGRHGKPQTNKPLNRDDWGLSKLLSRGN